MAARAARRCGPLTELRLKRSLPSMEFEWDDAKSEANRVGRGFGFDFAALIFEGPTLEAPDLRTDYGERRIQAIGEVDGFVLALVYTDRPPVRRIISARLANRKERALWLAFASR